MSISTPCRPEESESSPRNLTAGSGKGAAEITRSGCPVEIPFHTSETLGLGKVPHGDCVATQDDEPGGQIFESCPFREVSAGQKARSVITANGGFCSEQQIDAGSRNELRISMGRHFGWFRVEEPRPARATTLPRPCLFAGRRLPTLPRCTAVYGSHKHTKRPPQGRLGPPGPSTTAKPAGELSASIPPVSKSLPRA